MFTASIGNPDPEDCGSRVIEKAMRSRGSTSSTPLTRTATPRRSSVRRSRGVGDGVVLATKFSRPMGDDPNRRGTSRRWVVTAVEGSLRRLQTDHIDLHQVHRLDPTTEMGETLSALSDLVHSGKVRAIGRAVRQLPRPTSSRPNR